MLEYDFVKGIVKGRKPGASIKLPFLLLRQPQDCVEAGSESSFFAKLQGMRMESSKLH